MRVRECAPRASLAKSTAVVGTCRSNAVCIVLGDGSSPSEAFESASVAPKTPLKAFSMATPQTKTSAAAKRFFEDGDDSVMRQSQSFGAMYVPGGSCPLSCDMGCWNAEMPAQCCYGNLIGVRWGSLCPNEGHRYASYLSTVPAQSCLTTPLSRCSSVWPTPGRCAAMC